jgi:branched-chain amino acid aminotransferase
MEMAIEKAECIWMNGRMVPWDDAKVHVLSHVIHYGSALFEGIRCYRTPEGPAVFRLNDHIKRLINSCKIYRMVPSYGQEELVQATLETVRANHLEECYIRPVIYRGFGQMGVNPLQCPIDAFIAVWKWGKYLGETALTQGVDVMVSAWNRMAPNTFPSLAKSAGNYMNSQLIKMEAVVNGYDEGIALDQSGRVSEGSGENLFLVLDDELWTPPFGACILPGVTRSTVLQMANDLGIKVHEQPILRETLYIADELFFTGTASEITPIRSVDRIKVGEGKRGRVTQALQREFFALFSGEREDKHGWLTHV